MKRFKLIKKDLIKENQNEVIHNKNSRKFKAKKLDRVEYHKEKITFSISKFIKTYTPGPNDITFTPGSVLLKL